MKRYTLTATGHPKRAPIVARDLTRRQMRVLFEAVIDAGYTRVVCAPARLECADCGEAVDIREVVSFSPSSGLVWCGGCK